MIVGRTGSGCKRSCWEWERESLRHGSHVSLKPDYSGLSTEDRVNWLRESRAALGLTQKETASRLSVSLSAYKNWEQGVSTPKPWMWGRLRQQFEDPCQ